MIDISFSQMIPVLMLDTNILHNWSNYIDHGPPHDGVIKWKYYPHYWPFAKGIHRWPVDSPHKDQWRGTVMCSLICAWANRWANNRDAGDLRTHRAHDDVTVMQAVTLLVSSSWSPTADLCDKLHIGIILCMLSQWRTTLYYNVVPHWLRSHTGWSLTCTSAY